MRAIFILLLIPYIAAFQADVNYLSIMTYDNHTLYESYNHSECNSMEECFDIIYSADKATLISNIHCNSEEPSYEYNFLIGVLNPVIINESTFYYLSAEPELQNCGTNCTNKICSWYYDNYRFEIYAKSSPY